jgi:N-acyl-phosphatidylethanolamine-hydrolysing phospholipase D
MPVSELASAQHRDATGRFYNPWPDTALHSFGDLLRWRRTRVPPVVPTPAFPRVAPDFARPRAASGTLSATWIGHSTVLLQIGGLNVLTDPIWSERASPAQWIGPKRIVPPAIALDALPPLDIVLISHSHYDHLDTRTVRALVARHPDARWVLPLELDRTVRRWGVRSSITLDWWQECEVAGARVAATPARHFSARSLTDRRRTLWCGYAVRVGQRAVYFAGDTAYHPEFGAIAQRYGPFDLALLPIGAYEPRWFMESVHMNPEEAVRAYRDMAGAHPVAPPFAALGVHWGTFVLTDEPVDEPPRRTRDCWHAAGLDASRLWVLRHGETRRA